MLYYSFSRKIAYYHIAKTGGTSVVTLLKSKMKDFDKNVFSDAKVHKPLKHYMDLMPANNYLILTTIRNPLARIVSLYQFWKDKKHELAALDFKPFVNKLFEIGFLDKIEDLLSIDGKIHSNVRITKLESISYDLQKHLGCLVDGPFNVSHQNKSRKYPHYLSYYDTELATRIINFYDWCYSQGYYNKEHDNSSVNN